LFVAGFGQLCGGFETEPGGGARNEGGSGCGCHGNPGSFVREGDEKLAGADETARPGEKKEV